MSLEQEDVELPFINRRYPWLSLILAGDEDAIREAGKIAREQENDPRSKSKNDPTSLPPTK